VFLLIYIGRKYVKRQVNKRILNRIGQYPNLNIGITPKGNEILKNGKFESNALVFNSIVAQNKLTLTKDMHSISFYISYAEDGVKKIFEFFFGAFKFFILKFFRKD